MSVDCGPTNFQVQTMVPEAMWSDLAISVLVTLASLVHTHVHTHCDDFAAVFSKLSFLDILINYLFISLQSVCIYYFQSINNHTCIQFSVV